MVFCLYEKYVFSLVLFLCMIFVEITFCPSINLEQPVMVLVFFFCLTYQLSCGMRYLILFRTYEFTGFKRESKAVFCISIAFVERWMIYRQKLLRRKLVD